jgi:MFS family permease
MGAAASVWSSAREIAGIDLADRKQRGRVMSSLHGTYNMGAAVCPLLGGWLTDMFSYKAAFIGYAIATALAVGLGFVSRGTTSPTAPPAKVSQNKNWGFSRFRYLVHGAGGLLKYARI